MEFLTKRNLLIRSLWDFNSWIYPPGTGILFKQNALKDLVESTFDPGLLEWDRLQAEKIIKAHLGLFTVIEKEIFGREYVAQMKLIYSSPPSPLPVVKPIFLCIPPSRALVQLGYWGYRPGNKFQVRILDIPQTGAPSSG